MDAEFTEGRREHGDLLAGNSKPQRTLRFFVNSASIGAVALLLWVDSKGAQRTRRSSVFHFISSANSALLCVLRVLRKYR